MKFEVVENILTRSTKRIKIALSNGEILDFSEIEKVDCKEDYIRVEEKGFNGEVYITPEEIIYIKMADVEE